MEMKLSVAELRQLLHGKRLKKRSRVERISSDAPSMLIAATAYADGMKALASRDPEAGALLIGPINHRSVTHVILDEAGVSTPGSFTWGHAELNSLLRRYTALGLDAKGFWHSHPAGYRRLSEGDLEFVRKILCAPGNDAKEVLMPLFADGQCCPFIVYPDLHVVEAKLVLF